jgi:AcrR family transcriptional regulator
MSTTIDARIVKSRAKLRKALLELVREQRLDAITVADITARAGVGYATFFRHYTDKLELWREITDSLIGDFVERAAPLAGQHKNRGMARELCAYVQANREPLSAILVQGAEGVLREDLVRRAARLAGTISPDSFDDLPRDLALTHVVNAALGVVIWWLEHYDEMPAERMTVIIDRLVIQPVSASSSNI